MDDRRLARFTRPWTWAGPHLSVRSPGLTESTEFQNDTKGEHAMATITTKDGTTIYYKDWGKGQPIVFSHGWPLNSDDWDAQMLFFGQCGYRVIAHDRRCHGLPTPTRVDQAKYTYEGRLAPPDVTTHPNQTTPAERPPAH